MAVIVSLAVVLSMETELRVMINHSCMGNQVEILQKTQPLSGQKKFLRICDKLTSKSVLTSINKDAILQVYGWWQKKFPPSGSTLGSMCDVDLS